MVIEEVNYNNIFDILITSCPQLKPLYEEHIKDNDELLPHVFMATIADFVKQQLNCYEFSNARQFIITVGEIIGILEKAVVSSDENLQNVVWVSFLEYFHITDNEYNRFSGMVGPNLKKALDTIHGKIR